MQPESLFNEAVDRMRQGAYAEAIKIYQAIIDENPDYALAHCNMGIALMQLGRWNQAGVAMRMYVNLAPEDAMGHVRMGMILRELNYPAKALKEFRKALELNGKCTPAYNELGKTYMQIGKLGEARECFVQAAAIRPKSITGLLGLAEVYERRGMLDLALNICYKALAISSTERVGQVYARACALHKKRGEWDKARKAGEAAISQGENSAELCFDVGVATHYCGDREAALDQVRALDAMKSPLADDLRKIILS